MESGGSLFIIHLAPGLECGGLRKEGGGAVAVAEGLESAGEGGEEPGIAVRGHGLEGAFGEGGSFAAPVLAEPIGAEAVGMVAGEGVLTGGEGEAVEFEEAVLGC